MPEAIRTKRQMYERLAAGAFGNTNPQWFSVDDWHGAGVSHTAPLWGVRSLVPGGPLRLDCPAGEVALTALGFGCAYSISPMVDPWLTLRCDVMRREDGLYVYGVEGRRDLKWRDAFRRVGRSWHRLEAAMLLLRHLNANSLSDLEDLLDLYPDHVIELTALDRCYGTVPHRNGVVWEVRIY
jgi:hypothetical protein